MSLLAADVKAKARGLGADLVGIASGAVLDKHPPDSKRPQRPSAITVEDSKSVIVLARRQLTGLGRLKGHDDRHKQYSTELVISDLEGSSSGWFTSSKRRGSRPSPSPRCTSTPATTTAEGTREPRSRSRTRRSKPGWGRLVST